MEHQQRFEDDAGELEVAEDYVVLDDATTGAGIHLDLTNLRNRKTKIISSAKETIENGECEMWRGKKLSGVLLQDEHLVNNCSTN